MDLSAFDTRQKASEGVEFPLVINGETVMGDNKKPITFTIKGAADPAIHDMILNRRDKIGNTSADVVSSDLELAKEAVVGWSDNFVLNGNKPKFPKDVDAVFAIPAIRNAILPKVYENKAFMNGS